MELTQARLKELLHYDPETGELTWLVNRKRARTGMRAGCVSNSTGYRVIRLFQRNYAEHRLAYLYMMGAFPPAEVDHKDLDRANNKWSNLRPATSSQNKANRPARGKYPKGVCFHKPSGLFTARIHKNGQQISLGCFRTPEAASDAYQKAYPEIHGEFGRAA